MVLAIGYITHKNNENAEKLIIHLLNKKLIACANIFPINSFYLWHGKTEKSKEYVSIIKTSHKNWKKLESEVKNIHPYKVPCIIRINAKANKEFESWINSEIKNF